MRTHAIRLWMISISAHMITVVLLALNGCVNDNLTDLQKKGAPDATTVATSASQTSSSSSSSSVTSTATPVTATVSFAGSIKPMLLKYDCAGCHGGSYSSYTGASSLARSGQLYGTMSWASGYRRMPPSQKPTSAELALLAQWIKEGEQNN